LIVDEAEKEKLKAEVQKLGERGPARIAAVEEFLRVQAADGGTAIIEGLRTAAQIEGFERVIASVRQQRSAAASTSAPGSQQHPEPPREPSNEPGKWTEEQYQKASARERLDYVRQFPQPSGNGAGR
jgi:hypothetical protein